MVKDGVMNIHECPASAHSASLTSQREGGFFTLHFYTLTGSDIVCVLTGGGGGVCVSVHAKPTMFRAC